LSNAEMAVGFHPRFVVTQFTQHEKRAFGARSGATPTDLPVRTRSHFLYYRYGTYDGTGTLYGVLRTVLFLQRIYAYVRTTIGFKSIRINSTRFHSFDVLLVWPSVTAIMSINHCKIKQHCLSTLDHATYLIPP